MRTEEEDNIERRHQSNLERKLQDFSYISRLNIDESVLEFWENHKTIYPDLYKLSQIALAAPATQVSVERAFSALALILTDRRTNLREGDLNNTLLIK
jgi:hypothetical protein